MAQEFVLCENQSDLGIIALNKSVFETIAYITLKEMDSVSLDSKKNVADCKIKDNKLLLSLDVKLKFGTNVNAETKVMQERIYYNILNMTNFKCDAIDVNVVGFEI